MERQRARILRAYREAGADAVENYRRVLNRMIGERDRARLVPAPELPARSGTR